MGNRTNWFAEASRQLGIEFDIPFTAVLGDGTKIHATARVRDFGGANGMLLISSSAPLNVGAKQLLAEGYGYAVMDNLETDEEFDLEANKEMFADWGWCGDPADMPSWMR